MLTPAVDEDGAPFWEYAARGELRIQACADCGELRFPPRPCCPHCRSFATTWRRVGGRGRRGGARLRQVHPGRHQLVDGRGAFGELGHDGRGLLGAHALDRLDSVRVRATNTVHEAKVTV
ncbi:zinc ribbon domain-containing protein, partial [Streptomyces scabiei]|uniref:Zn-ribbon domain-containing OB-fold protein n=1 Tax=Streptomyces scabiei TaxID=1930 RepID=UPI0029AD5284